MKRKIKYVCEYCGIERVNKLELAKHELKCKEITATKKRIERLFKGLILHYLKLGYDINIICRDGDLYINIRYLNKY